MIIIVIVQPKFAVVISYLDRQPLIRKQPILHDTILCLAQTFKITDSSVYRFLANLDHDVRL